MLAELFPDLDTTRLLREERAELEAVRRRIIASLCWIARNMVGRSQDRSGRWPSHIREDDPSQRISAAHYRT
jgi:hypothetical protein